MERIIKPNWDIFKAKFSENPAGNFEWFCYLLFSKEYKRDYGIFRYINHKSSEVEIIDYSGKKIAFQAKFTISIAKHSNDLIGALNDLKTRGLDKLVIYSNQDFGQNNSNKDNPSDKRPKAQRDIEKVASDLNIEIIWRLASTFESDFVCIENSTIANHFFSNDHSMIDLISELIEEQNLILNKTKPSVIFRSFDEELNFLKFSEKQTILISGISGVGKTTLVSNYYNLLKDPSGNNDFGFYILKPNRFNVRNTSDIFSFSLDNFLTFHKESKNKVIVIDSAEKLCDISDLDAFKIFYKKLIDIGWKFIFTIIDEYKFRLLEVLNIKSSDSFEEISICSVEKAQLDVLSQSNEFSLPSDPKLSKLLTIPFYLDLYLENYHKNKDMSDSSFKDYLWDKKILKNNPDSVTSFLSAVKEKSLFNEYYFFYDSPYAKDLMNEGIINFDKKYSLYYFSHDIYEEWTLEKIIDQEMLNPNNFFDKYSNSHLMKKVFSHWLSEQSPNKFKKIISKLLENDIPLNWKNYILSSCLLSDYANSFFEDFDYLILDKENSLLNDLIIVAKTACIEEDKNLFKKYFDDTKENSHFRLFLTKPIDKAWEPLIEFIYNRKSEINIEDIKDNLLPLLDLWIKKSKIGITTRYSGFLALDYYIKTINIDKYSLSDENEKLVFSILTNSSHEIKNELSIFLKTIVEKTELKLYEDFALFLLKDSDSYKIALNLPIEVLNIFKGYKNCYTINKKLYMNKDKNFYTEFFKYTPFSPLTGNFYYMLKGSFDVVLNYIIEFVNEYVDYYKENKTQNPLELFQFEIEGRAYKQYGNKDLWELYRGNNSSLPYLLISMHMALEKILLDWKFETEEDKLFYEETLFHIIKHSKSVSLTSIIASCIFKFPDYTTKISMILFKEKRFFIYDNARKTTDKLLHKDSLRYCNGKKSNIVYIEALKMLDNSSHRKLSFFNILDYYLENKSELLDILNDIFDYHYSKKIDENLDVFEHAFYDRLCDLDKRNAYLSLNEEGKQELYKRQQQLIENTPFLKDIFEKQKQQQVNQELYYYYLGLENKLFSFFDGHEISLEDDFQNDVNELLTALILLENHMKDSEYLKESFEYLPFLVNIYLLHFVDDLDELEKESCFSTITNRLLNFFIQRDYPHKGISHAINLLPSLLEKYPNKKDNIFLIIVVSCFSHKAESVHRTYSSKVIEIISNRFWEIDESLANKLFLAYLHFVPKFLTLQVERDKNTEDWIEDFNFSLGTSIFGFNDKPFDKELPIDPVFSYFIEFFKTNKDEIINFQNSNLDEIIINTLKDIDTEILINLLLMLPKNLENDIHQQIFLDLSNSIFVGIKAETSFCRIDYNLKDKFYDKYSETLLSTEDKFLNSLLENFLSFIEISPISQKVLEQIIYVEDDLKTFNRFWKIWSYLRNPIVNFIKSNYYTVEKDKLISVFLFDVPYLNQNINWDSFRQKQDRIFFKETLEDLSPYPVTLSSITKLLNGAGKIYASDGLVWIYSIVTTLKHTDYIISRDTCNNICIYLNRYISANDIKCNIILKNQIIEILDVLIAFKSEKASILKNSLF